MNNYINYEFDQPILYIEIGGFSYSFTISGFPKEKHEWLLEVISTQMQEVHDRAVSKTKADFQCGFKKLLGIQN